MTAVEKSVSPPLEVWAGVECTVNRLGDGYYDQLERSGHAARLTDLDLLASLGVRVLRYPLLWERLAPSSLDQVDFSWSDERLEHLTRLGITPIAGFLHHGSGPKYTSLTDDEFPEKIATFAGAIAARYPWITDYTPINEPLTTARFSGLYGHWYPHAKDTLVFTKAVLNQCRGIVLAMRTIRAVNSEARLVQTEDLGKTFSTPTLSYQAEFENERRWLTYDLLNGRIQPGHAMWDYFIWLGIEPDELKWFSDNPAPPDVIGINHYITSERFLDERLARYPASTYGGNGRHAYADIEAVRVCSEGVAGPRAIMHETWERYGQPIAITEAHLGCTRDEQLRWLKSVWDAAVDCRKDGVEVRAITAWSAFGAYDWNSLLTRKHGHYEPGIFDLRSPEPRPTALAQMIRTLTTAGEYDHPVLDSTGWWQRFDRLCYPPVSHRSHPISNSVRGITHKGESSRPLLIAGATGTLGQAFARICERRGLAYYLLNRSQLDIADSESIDNALTQYRPWAVINAAGFVRVDDAELERDACTRENAQGPQLLAQACKTRGVALVSFSSDLVFNGSQRRPYVESDTPAPLNVYGASKLKAEQSVLAAMPEALMIRTSAFFGPWDKFNFANAVLDALARGSLFPAAKDMTISPTYVPDLVNATLDLLIDGERGIWHLTNSGEVTWAEFARMLATEAGYDAASIQARPTHSFGWSARRPAYSALTSERGTLLPSLEDALCRYIDESGKRRALAMTASRS